jgi:hypothetical protein
MDKEQRQTKTEWRLLKWDFWEERMELEEDIQSKWSRISYIMQVEN